jgi:hypothetical protein
LLVNDKRPIACTDPHGKFIRWFRDWKKEDPEQAGFGSPNKAHEFSATS